MQLGIHEPHKLVPEHQSEHGVAVRQHGLRHAMKAYYVRKESLRYCLRRVRVSEGDEVTVFVEAIDDGEDHRLLIDTGQCLNKVKANIHQDESGYR